MSEIKKIVFVLNGHDAVLRRWAVGHLCEALCELGFDARIIDLSTGGKESECEKADVVVVYRCFDLRAIRLMRRVRMQGPFIVYFIDDYIFQSDCKYSRGWNFTIDPMKEADVIMSSSSVLLSKIELDKPKILRRSVLDGEGMSILKQDYRREGPFSVGWFAGRGRGNLWDKFVADVLSLLDVELKNEEKCIFNCFGSRFSSKKYDRVSVREHVFFEGSDWKGLYSKMKSFNLGASINPLDEHDEFCWCKSELKFVETAAMGVPLITSRVPPYTEFIKDGENGFFASTPKEFVDKILLVMRNEPLSRVVSKNAFDCVIEHYDVKKNALKFIEDVLAAKLVVSRRGK